MIPVFLFPKARTSFIRGHTRQHKKEEHLFRLRSIGVDVSRADFGFYIDKNDYDGARALFSGVMKKGYIVVNPGAKSHLKRWPAEKFAGLCDRLLALTRASKTPIATGSS
jgi:ADP-heptose:LPS heptosyltransferase